MSQAVGKNNPGPLSGRISEAKQAWEWAKEARNWYLARSRWSLSIESTDRLYDVAHEWFRAGADSDDPPRALAARIGRTNELISSDSLTRRERRTVDLYYNVKAERRIEIGGHPIVVSMATPDTSANTNTDTMMSYLKPDVLHFHAQSREGQQAVIDMLQRLVDSKEVTQPALHLLSQWGWQRRNDLPPRTLDSVVLAAGVMEELRDDLLNFLDAEPDYVRRGIPYHRGYLLHGPPGTGKTSIVRAMAAHFGLDLWYAPLGDLDKDTKLLNVVNEIGPHSILLLEDVDVFHSTRDREDTTGQVSMAGLLNALDGVATPHGLIVFMTTNDLSVIDDALIRPGRVDLLREIGCPDEIQLLRMWKQFYAKVRAPGTPDWNWRLITFKGTTADAAELFKKHMNDADAAWAALTEGSQ